jgi:N-formylglutamate amidohydrolase
MNEKTLEKTAHFAQLQADLTHLIQALASFAGAARVQE